MKINLKKRYILLPVLGVFLSFLWLSNQAEVTAFDELQYIKITNPVSSYRMIYQGWIDQGMGSPMVSYEVSLDEFESEGLERTIDGIASTKLLKDDVLEVDVTVEQAGLYEIHLDYFVEGSESSYPLIKKEISHGEEFSVQYNEDYENKLSIIWEKARETPTLDRYGDEVPIPAANINEWILEGGIYDPSYAIKTPLKNYFVAGKNTIRFTMINSTDFYVSKITLMNSEPLISYQDYLSSHQSEGAIVPDNQLITVAVEDFVLKSDTNLNPSSISSPHMSQYSMTLKYLNSMNVKKPGQWLSYDVDVPEAGLYHMAIKGEMLVRGLPVYRQIWVNGEIPFQEFEQVRLGYQVDWQNHVLGESDPYYIYLHEGINQIRIQTSPGLYDHLDGLQAIVNDIQELSMEITNLTGGLYDVNRTWHIEEYIPDIHDRLIAMANATDAQYNALISYSSNAAAQFNMLVVAAQQLRYLADKPDEIIEKIYLLNAGNASAVSLISTSMTGLTEEPMNMDVFYLYTNASLPAPQSDFFTNVMEGVKSFFYSFIDPRYDISLSKDPEVVKVWVRKSKLQVDIMQRMVDNIFTPETGIKVELIVLAAENRIVLANAAGKTPDVVLSASGGSLFDYASRGMLADLSSMEGFDETSSAYNPNSFIPYIFEEGVYGIPETQDVALLFYRKDIMQSLSIDVPDTWDDVLEILPQLQSYGMNFYHPISSTSATKSINQTSSLIYMFGGDFYGETATDILIREPNTVSAIKQMVDLYNIYNLPLQVGSFYQGFRNGTLPIGVADQNMYIQLKYSAPELIGQWGVLPIPGTMNDEGIVERWDTANGSASILFNSSQNKDRSWEFIQWWNSASIQSKFSYEMVSNLGDLYLYMSANLEGFERSSWPEDSKEAILDQWEWIRIPPRLPGYYILEREISNLFNDVVIEKGTFQFAVDVAYLNIKREIDRKLDEFNYDEDNPYYVPHNETIEQWIGG